MYCRHGPAGPAVGPAWPADETKSWLLNKDFDHKTRWTIGMAVKIYFCKYNRRLCRPFSGQAPDFRLLLVTPLPRRLGGSSSANLDDSTLLAKLHQAHSDAKIAALEDQLSSSSHSRASGSSGSGDNGDRQPGSPGHGSASRRSDGPIPAPVPVPPPLVARHLRARGRRWAGSVGRWRAAVG